MWCEFSIDGVPYKIEVEGEFFAGKDEVLFTEKGSVIEHCSWLKEGYAVVPVLNEEEFTALKKNIQSILLRIIRENGIEVDEHFTLENYHHYVRTDEQHQSVIEKTRFLTFRDFNIDMERVVARFSEAVGKTLHRTNPRLPEEIIIMRINRPSSLDINPFHRDGYLDIWERVLNSWIPVAGCSDESSLPVLPGSHFWNEKDIVRTEAKGARLNGLQYHVPAVISYAGGLKAIRPNPMYGEAMIFTPFLIHGAALNKQKDTTRVSLELRLYYAL
jgi:ectoine hydroxylase-related dioxygenase (phytanoyl-CoA dioxygenase family)